MQTIPNGRAGCPERRRDVLTLRACILSALLAGAAVGGAGCAKRETPVEEGIRTQTLHFGNVEEPATIDPHIATMMAEWEIQTALFEPLLNLANDGRTFLPGAAERWEVSPDGLSYKFHLRQNATWSNGDPLTARDFFESLRRLLTPALGFPTPELIDPIVGARDFLAGRITDFSAVGVTVLDSQTLQLRLRYRAPYFLLIVSNLGIISMPVHLPSVEKFGGRDRRDGRWTLPGNLVSNGPFVLKEWRHNQVVVLTRNERYWDAARVRLREIRFYPNNDADAEERVYRAGQLHTTWGLPSNKLPTYAAKAAGELQRAPSLHTQFISFNCSRPPFTDPRMRRAFALAVDRVRITDMAMRGRAEPARSFVRPGTGGFNPPELKNHDPEEARRLLAAAGFPGGQGLPAIELRIASRGSDTTAVAEALQQAWKSTLGADVSINRLETKVLIPSLYAHDFQMSLSGYYYFFADASDPLARGEEDALVNFSTWHHPGFEAAVVAAREASTDALRLAAFATQERLLAEEAPYVPIFHLDRVHLVHPSVKGWRNNPFSLVDWRELWLEAPR